MAIVTKKQLEKIRQIIDGYTKNITFKLMGGDFLSFKDVQQSVSNGHIGKDDLSEDLFQKASLFGGMTADDIEANNMSYGDFKRELELRGHNVLTDAIEYAKRKAGQYITTLNAKVESGIDIMALEVEKRNEVVKQVRKYLPQALEQSDPVKWLTGMLQYAKEDWKRNYKMIARTEINNAFQDGFGSMVLKKHGPTAKVAKIVNPDACKQCVEAYLYPDGTPKLFPIMEIYGKTNAFDESGNKRSKSTWVATLESLHPNCRCVTVYVPEGQYLDRNFNFKRV
jgi:hypothetical protein